MAKRIEQAQDTVVHIEGKNLPNLNATEIRNRAREIGQRFEWKIKHSRLPDEKKWPLIKQVRERIDKVREVVAKAAQEKRNWVEAYVEELDAIARELVVAEPEARQDHAIFNAWASLHNMVWDRRNIGPFDTYYENQAKDLDKLFRKRLDQNFNNASDEEKVRYLEYMKETFDVNLEIARNADSTLRGKIGKGRLRSADIAYMLDDSQNDEQRKQYEKTRRLHVGENYVRRIISFQDWFESDPYTQEHIRGKQETLGNLITEFRGKPTPVFTKFMDGWETGLGAITDKFTKQDEEQLDHFLNHFDAMARKYAGEWHTETIEEFEEMKTPDQTLPPLPDGADALDEARNNVQTVLDRVQAAIENPSTALNSLSTNCQEADVFVNTLFVRAKYHYERLGLLQQEDSDQAKADGISEERIHALTEERSRIAKQLQFETAIDPSARTDLTFDVEAWWLDMTIMQLERASFKEKEPQAEALRERFAELLKKVQNGEYSIRDAAGTIIGFQSDTYYYAYTTADQNYREIIQERMAWRQKLTKDEDLLAGFEGAVGAADIAAVEALRTEALQKTDQAAKEDIDHADANSAVDHYENDLQALTDRVAIGEWKTLLEAVDRDRLPASQGAELEQVRTAITAMEAEILGEVSGAHGDREDAMKALKDRVETFRPFVKEPEVEPEPVEPPPPPVDREPVPEPPQPRPKPPVDESPPQPEPPPRRRSRERTAAPRTSESREARIKKFGKEITKKNIAGWSMALQNQLEEKLGSEFTKEHLWAAILALDGMKVKIKKEGGESVEKKIEGNPFDAILALANDMGDNDMLELPIDELVTKAKATVDAKNREKVAALWRDRGKERAAGDKEADREKPKFSNRELWGLLTEGGTGSDKIEGEFTRPFDLGRLTKPREELQQGPSKTPTVRLTFDWGIVDVRLQENGKLTAMVGDKNGKIVGDYVYQNMRADSPAELAAKLKEARKAAETQHDNELLWNVVFAGKNKDMLRRWFDDNKIATKEVKNMEEYAPMEHQRAWHLIYLDWGLVSIVYRKDGTFGIDVYKKDDLTKTAYQQKNVESRAALISEFQKARKVV